MLCKIFLIFLFYFSFCFLSAYGQEQDTIYFNRIYSPLSKENTSTNPLYKLQNDTIRYRGKPYKIILPENIESTNMAFGTEYFTGWENMIIPDIPVFLVEIYEDFFYKIYLDRNHNLNFKDDGPPVLLNGAKDSITLSFPNSKDSLASFNVNVRIVDFKDEDTKTRVVNFFSNHKNGKDNILLDSKYWLSTERYNYLITNDILSDDSVKIGLKDYDCNGFFNDIEDRIMIGNYKKGTLSDLKSKGTYSYIDTTVVKINNSNYEVVTIEKNGAYIVLKPSNLSTGRIEVGDETPLLQVKMLDDSFQNLSKLLSPEKYNLIDIWGTWCAGCILQTKELQRLEREYENLNIIALNYGDRKDKVLSYLSENKITWINGFTSTEINKAFMVDSYPYLMLIKDNKIILMQARIQEIEEILKNN